MSAPDLTDSADSHQKVEAPIIHQRSQPCSRETSREEHSAAVWKKLRDLLPSLRRSSPKALDGASDWGSTVKIDQPRHVCFQSERNPEVTTLEHLALDYSNQPGTSKTDIKGKRCCTW